MGSRLHDEIYWHFFTIAINYDSSQSMTVHDSLYSLLNYERLLFHCDERRITAHTLNSLTNESITELTSRRPECRSISQTVPLLFSRCHGNVFVNIRCHRNLCLGTCYLATDVPLFTASPQECVYWSVV
jgi:hypothetical protein